jgi:hypothetical protein
MADTNGAIAVHQQQPAGLARGSVFGGLIPASFAEAEQFAMRLAESGLVPEALRKRPADVLVVMLKGLELGLRPMLALSEIHVINGKAGCSAKLKMGMCLAKPDLCEDFTLIESNDQKATYRAKRVGKDAVQLTFTLQQAKDAGLLSRDPWVKFRPAMLRARCSSALADAVFPDIVQGILTTDELEDLVESRETPRYVENEGPPASAVDTLQAKLVSKNPASEQVIDASRSTPTAAEEVGQTRPSTISAPKTEAKPPAPAPQVFVASVLCFGDHRGQAVAALDDTTLIAQLQFAETKIAELPENQRGLKWVPQLEANIAAIRAQLEQRRQAAVKAAGGFNSNEVGTAPAPVREPGSDDGDEPPRPDGAPF